MFNSEESSKSPQYVAEGDNSILLKLVLNNEMGPGLPCQRCRQGTSLHCTSLDSGWLVEMAKSLLPIVIALHLQAFCLLHDVYCTVGQE